MRAGLARGEAPVADAVRRNQQIAARVRDSHSDPDRAD